LRWFFAHAHVRVNPISIFLEGFDSLDLLSVAVGMKSDAWRHLHHYIMNYVTT
jgi:hypothetical protein